MCCCFFSKRKQTTTLKGLICHQGKQENQQEAKLPTQDLCGASHIHSSRQRRPQLVRLFHSTGNRCWTTFRERCIQSPQSNATTDNGRWMKLSERMARRRYRRPAR